MKFRLEMTCDNAAFEDDPGEIARILRATADKVESGATSVALIDANGNRVGVAEFRGK